MSLQHTKQEHPFNVFHQDISLDVFSIHYQTVAMKPNPPKCKRTASNLFNPAKIEIYVPLVRRLPRDNGIHVLVCASERGRNTDTLKCVCQLMQIMTKAAGSTRRQTTRMRETHVRWIICQSFSYCKEHLGIIYVWKNTAVINSHLQVLNEAYFLSFEGVLTFRQEYLHS